MTRQKKNFEKKFDQWGTSHIKWEAVPQCWHARRKSESSVGLGPKDWFVQSQVIMVGMKTPCRLMKINEFRLVTGC